MNVKDLQIGDWVFYYAGYNKEESCNSRISGILTKNYMYSNEDIFLDLCGGDPFSSDELYPIPITGEILHRSGFIPCHGHISPKHERWRGSFGDYIIEVNRQDSWRCCLWLKENRYIQVLNRELQYIHELQHCFNLFDLENNWGVLQTDDPDWNLIST